ncbi:MAG: type I methionyl aminopeptidase [Candidatus Peregrinibacteria bacterium]
MSKFQIFSPKEIDALRRGGRILHECLKLVESLVLPGITTEEIDAAAEKFIIDQGGIPGFKGYQGFPGTLCTSVNDICVHGIPSADVLKDGDIISLDCGVIVGGLYTDACVTVLVGNVTPRVRELKETADEALRDAIKQVRAGARVGDISAAVEAAAHRHNFKPVKGLTGHGVGTTLHQYPDVPNSGTAGTGPVLPANTAIAIEPIITSGSDAIREGTDGWAIYVSDHALTSHAEHTLLVTEDGAEILT